jgi:hypothetical protein
MRLTARKAQAWVTLLLVGLMLVHPFVNARAGALLFVVASLGALSLSIDRRDRTLRFYFFIASALIIWSVFWNVHEGTHRIFVYSLCTLTYFLFIFIVIGYLMRTKEITKDDIFALINCYLIAATVFSFVYEIAFFLHSDAISFASSTTINHSVFLYFSFSTITTLGIGDIIPVSPFIRNVVIIEAIFGQFYIAIVVAYILTRYIQHRSVASARNDPPPPAERDDPRPGV